MELYKKFKDQVIPSLEDFKNLVAECKSEGYKVVHTQGSYDLLHIGHCRYLEKAKSKGDRLIVGVDSDSFVKERKGEGRPIVPEEERLETLLHTKYVDYVFLFSSKDEAVAAIQQTGINVLVVSESTKGSDFTDKLKQIHGSYCDEVVVLKPQAETSTSAKIRLMLTQGMHKFYGFFKDQMKILEVGVDDFFNKHKNGEVS